MGRIRKGTGHILCPSQVAGTHECSATFMTEAGAISHAENKHEYVNPKPRKKNVNKRGKGKYPCPRKDICTKMFSDPRAARKHAKKKHSWPNPNARAPTENTPLEEGAEEPVPKAFKSDAEALTHAYRESQKEKKVVPCPLAERLGCAVMFVQQRAANGHVFQIHKIRFGEYHCPEDGCDQVLFELFKCEEHLREAHGLSSEDLLQEKLEYIADTSPSAHLKQRDFRFQCPMRGTEGCLVIHQSPWMMEAHVKDKHPNAVDPDGGVELIPACENYRGIKVIFKNSTEAVPARETLPQPKKENGRYVCQDQDCSYSTVYLQSIWIHFYVDHMDVVWPCPHADELGCDEVFKSPVVASEHGVDHYVRFKCQFANCVANARGLLLTTSQMRRHRDDHKRHGHLDGLKWTPQKVKPKSPLSIKDEGGQTGKDSYDAGMREFMETVPMLVLRFRTTIDYSELPIDPKNPRQQSLRKRIGTVLGNKCMGPSKVERLMVSDFCPDNVVLTEENLLLIRKASKGTWVISKRCKACHSRAEFYKNARVYELEMEEGQVYCKEEGCNLLIWQATSLCKDHILNWEAKIGHPGPEVIKALQRHFESTARKSWRLKTGSLGKEVFRRIQGRESKTPLVVCIDLEVHISSGRVFQIGICDLEGKKLLDCQTILSKEELERTKTAPGSFDERLQQIFDFQARSRPSEDDYLPVHVVASRLKQLFPRPEKVIFIAWAKWSFDLRRLREWLEHAGYRGVLPGDERCYLVMEDYRKNLDTFLGTTIHNGKRFPLRLPVFFPVVMGDSHELVGTNHQALYDAKQLACLVNRLAVLCGAKPATPAPTS